MADDAHEDNDADSRRASSSSEYAERFDALAQHAHHRNKFDPTTSEAPDEGFVVDPSSKEVLEVDTRVEEIAERIGRRQDGIEFQQFESDQPLYNPRVDFQRCAHKRKVDELLEADLYKDVARITHSPFFRILAGKTQLFPIAEHSLVRNRLTHSLEVSDIAKRIAERINAQCRYFSGDNRINRSVTSAAGLAHDIGHPPFAHSGEECLSALMAPYGGFESNAQTLRVLSRLEQRLTSQREVNGRYTLGEGLNLTYRTLASVIKYDWVLFAVSPSQRTPGVEHLYKQVDSGVVSDTEGSSIAKKGFYREEASVVDRIKTAFGLKRDERLYTLECSIMDIADDIAYSTYDLEDAMVVGLLHPFDVAAVGNNPETGAIIRERVNAKLAQLGFSSGLSNTQFSKFLYAIAGHNATGLSERYDFSNPFRRADFALQSYVESKAISRDRAMRRRFTEDRISKAIAGISLNFNAERPFLSTVTLQNRQMIETLILKEHNFERVIKSPQLRIFEMKVKRMLETVFFAIEGGALDAVLSKRALRQLDDDELYLSDDPNWRKRLACDVISAMTERDVLSAYNALTTGKDLRATELHLIW